jgi:hypothetical protein
MKTLTLSAAQIALLNGLITDALSDLGSVDHPQDAADLEHIQGILRAHTREALAEKSAQESSAQEIHDLKNQIQALKTEVYLLRKKIPFDANTQLY